MLHPPQNRSYTFKRHYYIIQPQFQISLLSFIQSIIQNIFVISALTEFGSFNGCYLIDGLLLI